MSDWEVVDTGDVGGMPPPGPVSLLVRGLRDGVRDRLCPNNDRSFLSDVVTTLLALIPEMLVVATGSTTPDEQREFDGLVRNLLGSP